MESSKYTIPDHIRRSLLNKSRSDRRFFDSLWRLVWCECKAGNATKSHSWEEWADIELPSWKHDTDTPRSVLSRRELTAVQRFIDTHTFHTLLEGKTQIAADLAHDCAAEALNCLVNRYA